MAGIVGFEVAGRLVEELATEVGLKRWILGRCGCSFVGDTT